MAENTVLLGFRAGNIRGYEDGECSFSFVTERIADEDKAESAYSSLSGSLHDRKVCAIYGINASGKTTLLSLIRFVLSVYLSGKDLEDSHSLLRRFHDGKDILIDAVFSSRGRIYRICSKITEENGSFVFREEIIYELRSDALLSPETLGDSRQYSELARRSSLSDDMKAFLKHGQSIARLSIAEEDRPAICLFERHTGFRPEDFMDIPDELVQYLDSSLLSLKYSGHDFVLAYRNKEQKEIPLCSMTEILSSGTMETLKLFSMIIRILKSEGYLLADGMDGSTNKTILINIIELFMRKRTNPHAAHIIFTTHYQELLDILPGNDLITLTTMDDMHP